MGPLTTSDQRALVEEHVADAVAKGAKVLMGGERPRAKGWWFPPTVLTNVDHAMRAMREETFGPLLPVMSSTRSTRRSGLANDSEFGLTASGLDALAADGAQARRGAAGGHGHDQRPPVLLRRADRDAGAASRSPASAGATRASASTSS